MPPSLFKLAYVLLLVALGALIITSLPESDEAAVAQSATAAVAQTQTETPAGYYPPAPSRAVGMTLQWRRFADTIDRVCAASFNYAMSLDSRAQQIARYRGWTDERAESVIVQIWSEEDRRIDLAATKLGRPPERPRLFARWHANVARRASLFHQASEAAGAGDWHAEDRIFRRIDGLKAQADRLGQRFGLRICTSN